MASALAQYYAAQAQQLANQAPLTAAQARNTNAQADVVESDAAARQAQEYAGAGLAGAQGHAITAKLPTDIAASQATTGLVNTQAGALAERNPADIAQTQSLTQGNILRNAGVLPTLGSDLATAATNRALTTTQTGVTGLQLDVATPGVLSQLPRIVYGDGTTKTNPNSGAVQYHAKGTSEVKASAMKPKGTDTIPAMLSPGEAVLNRGAAEHAGKDVIDHLNKMGMLRMKAQKEIVKHGKALHDAHKKGKLDPAKHAHSAMIVHHFALGTASVGGGDMANAMPPLNMAAILAGAAGQQGGPQLAGMLPPPQGGGGGQAAAPAPARSAPKPKAKHKGKH